ncbi:MAG: DUF6879 family protein [Candidatus Pacearchaeota archaeon]
MENKGFEDLGKEFKKFKKSVFRLQTLPKYSVEGEQKEFEAYLNGEIKPPFSKEYQEWLAGLISSIEAGKTITQLLRMFSPMTPYIRFGLDWYWGGQYEIGVSVNWILPEKAKSMESDLQEDFWLFDEERVWIIVYDSEGRPLKAVLETNPSKIKHYLAIKEKSIRNSVDLKDVYAMIRKGELK